MQLAREAARAEGDIIVQCGVHFMAETSKLLNPDKTVLIPDMGAGCSLAESITGADVRALELQTDFLNDISDATEEGLGNIVDANMARESARLTALQVQRPPS